MVLCDLDSHEREDYITDFTDGNLKNDLNTAITIKIIKYIADEFIVTLRI